MRYGRSAVFSLFRKKPQKRSLSPGLQASLAMPDAMSELKRYFSTPEGREELSKAIREETLAKHPPLAVAVWADANIYSSLLMGPPKFTTKRGFVVEALRMALDRDAFLPMVLYRVRTRLLAREVPVLPDLLHRACMVLAQIDIGFYVTMEPGVYIPHGQVVIDGQVTIGTGTVISPWVTLGRNGPSIDGPRIGRNVFIGTGAKILGPVVIGNDARIGANAVVLRDVPPRATVGGIPAKILRLGNEPPGSEAFREALRKDMEGRDDLEARRFREQVQQALAAQAGARPPVSSIADYEEAVRSALQAQMAGRTDAEAVEFREKVRRAREERARKQ